jgi:small glutamine-rich tetratricopeptide repeat-containing protein alpha
VSIQQQAPTCNAEVLAKAKQLKEAANKRFQSKQYKQAVELYTEALILPLLPPQDLAVLYSNRSAAHLGQGEHHKALQDAKKAQSLWPTWSKGYFRKGKALLALNEFTKARKGIWQPC